LSYGGNTLLLYLQPYGRNRVLIENEAVFHQFFVVGIVLQIFDRT